MKHSGSCLELFGAFVTVAIQKFRVILFWAFGLFLVGSVVQEFEHVFFIFLFLLNRL